MNKLNELSRNPLSTALKYTNLLPINVRMKFAIISLFNFVLALIDILALVILGIATIKSLDLPAEGKASSIDSLVRIFWYAKFISAFFYCSNSICG